MIYNLFGFILMLFGLWLCLWPHKWEPAPEQDGDPGFGDDDYIVRTDEVEGYAWGERLNDES